MTQKMPPHRLRWIAALAMSAASLAAHAHGDEPHGDEPHPVAGALAGGPRFEAATDAFELVGRIEGGVLTLFISRFETSEPVQQATVELESGDLKAVAAYQADQGSYVVNDPGFIQARERPGAHALVVTVAAGNDADLLEATLVTAAPAQDDSHDRFPLPWAMGGAAVLAAAGGSALALRRRRTDKGETA